MPRFDSAYLSPDDPRLIAGTPQEQERAWREFAKQREIQAIMTRIDREIPRSELIFGRHWIEVAATGELFHPWAGDVWFAPEGVVYYMDASGFPRLLEPATPRTRAELELRQQEKEQRRADRAAAAKQRREQLKAAAR